jgi:signal transduction histidine kinase
MPSQKNIQFLSRNKDFFRSFSLRTQLLLILLFLLVMSISSLTIIYSRSEAMLMDKLADNIDDLTNAIRISVEELSTRGDSTQRLKSYVDMLKRKGIQEISIISDQSQVIASSNPKKIGTAVDNPKKMEGMSRATKKKDLMITAKLGEPAKPEQRPYNVIMPVSIKGQNLGYIHISLALDDFNYLQRRNHLKRILSTLFAFSIGIIICIIFADKYTEPIKKIANASRKIAEGELVKIRDTGRADEIGILVRSYNEMVDKLNERKELEEKLKHTEQLSMIGQLASGIAHEVRNPLNFLSLSVGHIKERLAEEKVKGCGDVNLLLDDLKKEIYRVNELINNFLFVGKPITLHREWITYESLMRDVFYLLKDKIREGVEVTVGMKDDAPIFCDREYMRICLINLILNSVQAIDDKGKVAVEFGRDDGFSSISVTDDGKGINKDDIDKIFEPYFSTKKLGIGLGLTITKRLVDEHGGTVTIESAMGEKTVITIKVPFSEVA